MKDVEETFKLKSRHINLMLIATQNIPVKTPNVR